MIKYLIIVLFGCTLSGCFLGEKRINIQNVSKQFSWTYQLIPGILFERQYSVLIDGELDTMAALEIQHRVFGPPYKENTIVYGYIKLPKGKFKLYLNADESGKERFIYHPFLAKKGWVKVQMTAALWDPKDSTRAYVSGVPGPKYGGIKVVPESELW